MPIYRQILDQIKYQIATGTLSQGDRMPSVRLLAAELTVNQNTVLKVYSQLCQERILQVDRGNGTFVSASGQALPLAEREAIVSKLLGEAIVQARHFKLDRAQLHELLDEQYKVINQRGEGATTHE